MKAAIRRTLLCGLMIVLSAAGCNSSRTSAVVTPRDSAETRGSSIGIIAEHRDVVPPLSAYQGVMGRDYLLFVASEATDEIALVRFSGGSGRSGRVERKHITGVNPADPDGPHGVAVSPDGVHYYVTTAHGTPFGYLFKYTTAADTLKSRVELGNFPASLQISPDGHYAWVVNFNLHGDMVPSSVSVVATGQMVEIARITTCTMPHGSRLSGDGAHHYSVCMMDDMLVDIDARGLKVDRHFVLTKGTEHGMMGPPVPLHGGRSGGAGGAVSGGAAGGGAAGGGAAGGTAGGTAGGATTGLDVHAGHGMVAPLAGSMKCSPTWVVPAPSGTRVYVACNASNDIVEIDTESWTVRRRINAGDGVYNLAVTSDGRLLVATNKRGRSVSVIDIATGREVGRVSTLRPIVHGVAISDDNRFGFISVEGYGAEPGTVEMIDLATVRRVASVDVGQMAGGIDFWRSEPTGAQEPKQ